MRISGFSAARFCRVSDSAARSGLKLRCFSACASSCRFFRSLISVRAFLFLGSRRAIASQSRMAWSNSPSELHAVALREYALTYFGSSAKNVHTPYRGMWSWLWNVFKLLTILEILPAAREGSVVPCACD